MNPKTGILFTAAAGPVEGRRNPILAGLAHVVGISRLLPVAVAGVLALATAGAEEEDGVRFRGTSPYHTILVYDQNGYRILSFDGTTETRMSLSNPLEGHFEYTEFFHMAWLWNTQVSDVLLIGLGGASVQRSFEHYYPQWRLETVEIDEMVRQVAREHFGFKESPTQRVRVEDGRVFVKRSRKSYDVMILDAYTKHRYGSAIPYHLVTREFFTLASERLTTNGVLAYNVIGTLDGWQADVLGSVYKTMKSVFPQVYLFPASGSQNVVLIATKSSVPLSMVQARQRAEELVRSGQVTLPTFRTRFQAMRWQPGAGFYRSRVLTDDYAPLDGLLTRGQ
jgi:spermidine synthase